MDIATFLKIVKAETSAADAAEAPTRTAAPASTAPARPAAATGAPARETSATSPAGSVYSYGKGVDHEAAAATLAALGTPALPSMQAISSQYPHVMQRLRDVWADPRRLQAALRELLLPARPGRQGFSPEALLELTQLLDYCDRHCLAASVRPAAPWPPSRAG